MNSSPSRDGWRGWLAVFGVVAAYDVWALRTDHQTLSEYAHDHPTAALVVPIYLICHFHRWPSRLSGYDPLQLLATRLARGKA